MIIVVCYRSTESQLTWSRTDDYCLKTFDIIPYVIHELNKSITHIMAWLFVSVQDYLKLSLITTISGYKIQAVSARLVWSYILLWRNHLKARPPWSGLIGAKIEKQRFDLTIWFYVENATSGPQNMLRHIKSST